MIELLQPEAFDRVFSIMLESFPPDERRTREEQAALLEKDIYRVYVLKNEDHEIVAFIAAWEFEDFVFLEHFAVEKSHRNGGKGGQFLSELVGRLNKRVCLEVEPPDAGLASRRIAFYERNGFTLNPYPYIQPAITSGRNPIPLMIMSTDGGMDLKTFEKMRTLVYEFVYNCEV